jgi:hypothetical protein
VPAGAASRDGPASGTSGVPPEAIAALAALAGLLLLLILRRHGEVRLNLGLTCAALLGVFGIGAVAGALFATRAAPRGTDRATAQSGLLLAGAPSRGSSPRTASAARWAHARRVRVPTELAAAPARRTAAPARAATPPAVLAFTSPVTPVTRVARPAPSTPPGRRTRPRIRVQARVDGGARNATDSSLGGGIRAGDPLVVETGGGLKTGTDLSAP